MNQNKLGRVRRGGEKETNKEGFTYVSLLSAVVSAPRLCPLKLQGVTSPPGLELCSQYHGSITCAHQPGFQGDWKRAGSFAFVLS